MYKTTYQAALDAQKLKYEDLFPKTREQVDQVKNVESELAEIYESLKDAEPADKAGINENIGTVEKLLQQMDEAVVKKINGNTALKAKVEKMQNGIKEKRAGAPAKQTPGATTPPAQQQPPATTTPASTQQQAPGDNEPAKVVPITTATPAAKKADSKPGDDKEKPAKKRNWFVLIATAVVTVALAGYGVHANQNKLWPFNKK